MPDDPAFPEPPCCSGCPIDRRGFVQRAGLAALGALLALGVPRRAALAMPPMLTRALRLAGPKPVYPIPAQDGVQIDRENEVILVRWEGVIYAFNLSCPHQHTALRWRDDDSQFQCPKHHSKYRPDGSFISGRATRGMDRFSLTRSGDELTVDVDSMHKQDEDRAGWDGAALHL